MPYQKAKADQPYESGEPTLLGEPPIPNIFDTVEPDDSLLYPGLLLGWFDPTDGSATFNLKGKTLNGHIVSTSINLS